MDGKLKKLETDGSAVGSPPTRTIATRSKILPEEVQDAISNTIFSPLFHIENKTEPYFCKLRV